jgi:glucose/arabinose dehydrogenase
VQHRLAAGLGACVLSLALLGCADEVDPSSRPSPSASPSTPASSTESATAAPSPAPGPTEVVGTIASGLEVPWGLAFLADGDALVTERDSGRILALTRSGSGRRAAPGSAWRVREIARLDGGSGSEGGVLGIAARPVDEAKPLGPSEVYVYLTTATDNRVLRGVWDGQRIEEWDRVLTGIPRSDFHDGGRLAFGPDGFLHVSTGDAGSPELAQDRTSLAGKILRITTDGEPAPGNPFDSRVWSYGHRNVQGLAWDDDGQLWASEFGQNTWDELKRVEKGGNHGWPMVEGRDGPTRADDGTALVAPAQVWSTDDASPSGLAFLDGRLWMGGLRGERLWEYSPAAGTAGRYAPKPWFQGEFGRIRTVVPAPDGTLWMTTSNRDGRGDPQDVDDRILSVRVARS